MPWYIAIEYNSTEKKQINDYGTVENSIESAWDSVKSSFDPSVTVIHEIPTRGWMPLNTKPLFKKTFS